MLLFADGDNFSTMNDKTLSLETTSIINLKL